MVLNTENTVGPWILCGQQAHSRGSWEPRRQPFIFNNPPYGLHRYWLLEADNTSREYEAVASASRCFRGN